MLGIADYRAASSALDPLERSAGITVQVVQSDDPAKEFEGTLPGSAKRSKRRTLICVAFSKASWTLSELRCSFPTPK